MRTGTSILAQLLFVGWLVPAAVHGQTTWYVDDDNCPGPGSGTEVDPFCSIQDGIVAASDTDTVLVAPGTYNETIDFVGKAITLRSSDGPAVTIIDATGAVGCTVDNCSVVKCVSGEGAGTVLDGFTITGGTGTTWVDPEVNTYLVGGGMFNEDSNPTLTNCTFSGNSVDRSDYAGCRGGGMFNENSSPTLTNCTFSGNLVDHSDRPASRGGGMFNASSHPMLTHCTFSGNTAGSYYRSGSGGGMYNDNSNPTLTDCTFSGNTAAGGGGMSNIYESSPTLTDCTFTENTATFYCGGGVDNWNSNSTTLTNCTFIGNWAYYGGGMSNKNESSPTLANCTFTENTAGYLGGGMNNEDGSSPILSNCTFSGNWAYRSHYKGYGGGMSNRYGSSPTLTNCTFSGNWADEDGGGMYNQIGSPTLTNCTISGNSADEDGGGMYNRDSSPTLTNCTFSSNSAAMNGDAMACDSPDQQYPSSVGLANCILWNGGDEIWNNDGSTITMTYSDIRDGWPGTGNIDADPLFVDADGLDNIPGTADDDLRLSTGSPCIDSGNNAALPPEITTDIDGNPRFVDDPDTDDCPQPGADCGTPPIVDMGAYEFQGGGEPIPTVSEWGMVVMTLLLLTAGTVVFMRRRPARA